jgi:hypothetical protein
MDETSLVIKHIQSRKVIHPKDLDPGGYIPSELIFCTTAVFFTNKAGESFESTLILKSQYRISEVTKERFANTKIMSDIFFCNEFFIFFNYSFTPSGWIIVPLGEVPQPNISSAS